MKTAPPVNDPPSTSGADFPLWPQLPEGMDVSYDVFEADEKSTHSISSTEEILEASASEMAQALLDNAGAKPMEQAQRHIDERFLRMEERVDHRHELLLQKIDDMNARWDERFKAMDERSDLRFHAMMDKFDQRFERVEEKLVNVEKSASRLRWWIAGAVIALFTGMGGILVMLGQMQNSWLIEYAKLLGK